jgi:acyl-CoA hydrolase
MEPRPVSFSQTTLTELMIPSYANFGGKIHGGILLSLIDKVAYGVRVAARRDVLRDGFRWMPWISSNRLR